MKRPTLQSIADLCGLSKSLVAQVLRDPEHSKAAQATKKRILEAAGSVRYVPNVTARKLATGRCESIGVLMPTLGGEYGAFALALDKAFEKRGLCGLFSYFSEGSDRGKAEADRAFERILQHGVDGIICFHYNESYNQAPVPVLCYGNERPVMDCVYPDKKACGEQAIRYLVERGHREIGVIGFSLDLRTRTMLERIRELQLTMEPAWFVDSAAGYRDGRSALLEMARTPRLPSAIVVHNDMLAFGVLRAAHELGMRLPRDLSILSFGNIPETRFMVPALTTFDWNFELGADMMAETLLRRIADPSLPQQKRLVPADLIERESVLPVKKR